MGLILMIVVILLLIAALPTWGYSRKWGARPSGGLGLGLLVIVGLLFLGGFRYGCSDYNTPDRGHPGHGGQVGGGAGGLVGGGLGGCPWSACPSSCAFGLAD